MLAVFKLMTGMEGAVSRTASSAAPMILGKGAVDGMGTQSALSRRPPNEPKEIP